MRERRNQLGYLATRHGSARKGHCYKQKVRGGQD
jgi:hypothetical protein